MSGIIERIMAVPEAKVGALLEQVSADFAQRHLNLRQRFLDRFDELRGTAAGKGRDLRATAAADRLLLSGGILAGIGGACSVPRWCRTLTRPDLPAGAVRFILSLRATGEGHISSITFRSGIVHRDLRIEVDPAGSLLTEPRQIANTVYEGPLFQRKLWELGLESDFTRRVLERLGSSFGLATIAGRPGRGVADTPARRMEKRGKIELRAQSIWMLARSNYEVQFEPEQDLSERIIFPSTPSQRNGIEDARFVRFRKDEWRRMCTLRRLLPTTAG